ncbi:hypothetical protein GCM10009801_09340 [Streptomyces albiaxialis]|uniref:Integral membrane protein n=1 Tax=Streptomyces albiaxialis TaxID=329523 RepID=A0ABN2VL14_9ACTN
MNTLDPKTGPALTDPRTRAAFRGVKRLVGAYAALSVATVAVAVLLRDHHDLVTDAVWIRGVAVAVSSLAMCLFVARAARGSRPAFRRMRIICVAMVVAIAVIVALPGAFPVWMRVEQAVCGLFLLPVLVLTGRGRLAELFADRR